MLDRRDWRKPRGTDVTLVARHRRRCVGQADDAAPATLAFAEARAAERLEP
jgi:hypothetical protein